MTEPKIRYDIQATAKGGAEVASLTSELSKLDDALDPQTAARARELSAELQRLGQEQSAIAGFLELKRTSVAARDGLDQAQAAAQSFAKELAASEKPTRAQAGHLEKLRDAVQGGKAALQDQTQALDVARSKLTELGLASDGLSAKQGQVGKALESAKLEARTLAAEYSALQKAQQAAAASADLLAAAETEAAAAAERLGAADGAAAMRQLEQAARQAEVELAQLTDTLRSAEATAQEFARASDLAASSSQDDVAATQRRVQAAQALISAENQLTTEQRELAAQRNAGRAGLVAEAQALLASARAADESRLATQRLVAQTRSAGDAIKAAFAQTGVRSIQAIEAELSSVGSSVSLLERKFRAGAITADDLARAVAGAAVRMNARNAEIAQVPALPGQFARLGEQVNGLVSKFGALSAAVATVGFAAKPSLDATVALESMRRVLTTVTGSAESAQVQIDFLRVAAQRSGQSFDTIGQSFAKFAASAAQSGLSMGQIRDVFAAVALAAGNLGLSTEKTENALTALGQIASKGVVSMEELRQQLGEALPGVLPLLAKELGLTQRELQKVVASGQLLATEAIPAIGRSLGALQPQGGAVSGLTAQWNRFINVVKEAGTVLTEGPIGKVAGVVIGALAGVLRDLAVVVTGASEAFKLFGLTVVSVFDFLRRDITFDQLKGRISDFAVESGNRLEKFQATAYGAAEASTALSASTKGLGTSFARLALDQQKAIESAGLAVQTSEKYVEAMKAEGEATATLASLIGDETSKRQAAALAADSVAAAAARHASAEQALLQVLIDSRAATIAKATAEGQNAEAIKATVDALNTQIEKATASAEKSQAQANASRAQALAMQLSSEAARDNSQRLDELRRNVEAAELAFTSKQRALRLDAATSADVRQAAEALAKAKGLLRDAIDDVSAALERNLKLLRADAELAKAGLQLQLEQTKNAERLAREQGNDTAARQANIRVRELELRIGALGIDLKRQEAEAGLRELDTLEKNLRASGLLNAEKQLEIETRRKVLLASVLETAAQNESNAGKREEVANLRAGKAAREEYGSAIGSNAGATERDTKAVRENTEARGENSNSILRQDAALEKLRNGPVLGSLGGPSQDGINFGVRSAGGPANKVDGLTPIDSFGNLIRSTPNGGITRTGSGQLDPPDNSGDWFFNTARRGEGPFGLGVWELKPEAAARRSQAAANPQGEMERVRNQFASLYPDNPNFRPPVPQPAPAPTPLRAPAAAPATAAPGGASIVLNFGSRSYSVIAPSRSQAEALVRELEEAYRNSGGG